MSSTETLEVNFDGLIGPSHNYGGMSDGNLASQTNAGDISNPREAALQGLEKMRMLVQAVGERLRAQYDQPWGAQPRKTALVVIAEHDNINEQAIRAELGA